MMGATWLICLVSSGSTAAPPPADNYCPGCLGEKNAVVVITVELLIPGRNVLHVHE